MHNPDCTIVFEINSEGSFVGSLTELSQTGILSSCYFIASREIHCLPSAEPTKFSGFDTIPTADSPLEEIIGAFFHYAYIVTNKQLVFCDIQGMDFKLRPKCLLMRVMQP